MRLLCDHVPVNVILRQPPRANRAMAAPDETTPPDTPRNEGGEKGENGESSENGENGEKAEQELMKPDKSLHE